MSIIIYNPWNIGSKLILITNLKNNFKLSFFLKAYNGAAVIHFGRLQHLRRGYGAHGTCCAHSLWGCAP